ncbi:hypothetical protein [Chitinophaga pinensis]|uniref:Gliding motility-associated protein GldM N-terminal domain-containing protein n=1 Tax=Chitinophaga pinensis (strain ATCC 43595 / DSM 2588 / LMG 13176 / NBRC 15968 / NCIMB 11800 / UQM 2034) TaxID=485918 RepID=A0A979G450_CHIPD|nr:hypothetical protein [Chitinophaga pinensis]ACU60452.1 hypothetical protein Cpin_2975 [Chitinophaga pinensis DSM 2588]
MLRPLFILMIVLFSATAHAQSVPVEDVSKNLLTWTRHLHSNVDKYFTRDKGAELVRNLELLKTDLAAYTKTRKNLSDSIFRKNVAPGNPDPGNAEVLKTQMGEVLRQMRNVTDLTNNELRAEGDRLNDQIYNVLNSEGAVFLSYLEAFLTGKEVTKKEMALDNGAAYGRLQEAIGLIGSIQDRIKQKM